MAVARIGLAGVAGGMLSLLSMVMPATAQAPTAKADAPAAPPVAPADASEPIVYIFSGTLTGEGETYSGTLVAAADGPQFELKLSKGATCDASKIEPDKGLLRLPETPCSDGRMLKALFVYQAGGFLRVYGTVGPDRFSTQAHALPSDATDPAAAKPASPPADLMDRPK